MMAESKLPSYDLRFSTINKKMLATDQCWKLVGSAATKDKIAGGPGLDSLIIKDKNSKPY